MLGQKKDQARGNTVRGNLAHSFSFKADPKVRAENNREVTELVQTCRHFDVTAIAMTGAVGGYAEVWPARRLVLKCPEHLWFLDALLEPCPLLVGEAGPRHAGPLEPARREHLHLPSRS